RQYPARRSPDGLSRPSTGPPPATSVGQPSTSIVTRPASPHPVVAATSIPDVPTGRCRTRKGRCRAPAPRRRGSFGVRGSNRRPEHGGGVVVEGGVGRGERGRPG